MHLQERPAAVAQSITSIGRTDRVRGFNIAISLGV